MDSLSFVIIGIGAVAFLVVIGAFVWALVDVARRQNVTGWYKLVWVLVLLFFPLIGPILYLALGEATSTAGVSRASTL